MASGASKGHNVQEEKKPPEGVRPPKKQTRREFLKFLGYGAAAVVAGKMGLAGAQERETRVAQATAPNVRGHAEASVATQTARVVEITNTEPIPVSSEDFKRDYGYMFENRNATIVNLPTVGADLGSSATMTIGDWEIRVVRDVGDMVNLHVKNTSFNYESTVVAGDGAKAVLLPFPESQYAKGPMLAIVESYASVMYFYNKVAQRVTEDIVSHQNFFGTTAPKIGTDVFQNEPYIVLAPEGSLTSDGDMKPGTRFVQYALLATTMSRTGDGPAPSGAIFERRD